ncbi:hypothetical protein MF672_038840 [Actinomadura sp. ATCC 31491]|uniref:LamG domain-containing protein n=1 Tax=Actinomadura luzonensis TaxID=2805427 RepID=A0ABT0G528_9ACTN|nr:hypothetical protein [Actinomadura luzonensis]MCK2219711.1 hypothetical protein [Actinomadura luzonensis]
MAVRFDASGESYNRALALGAQSAWTVSMWVKLAANRLVSTILWQIDNGSSDWLTVRAWDGSALAIETDGEWNALLSHTLTVGTWTYVGIGAETNGDVSRVIGDAGGTLTTSTPNYGATTFNAGFLLLGVGGLSTSWLNGSIAAVKVWSGVRLTTDELLQEAYTYQPQRTSNLRCWYPFDRLEATDFSGNANTLSGGTGASLDPDGPPISWSTGRHRLAIPTSSTPPTGSVAAGLPPLGAASTGAVRVSGSATHTLPGLSASATGAAVVAGSAALGLPSLSASAAGTAESPGELAVGLPSLGAAATGHVQPPGEIAATLPGISAGLDGTVFLGIVDHDLPALSASAVGAVVVSGALGATLPGLVAEVPTDIIYDITVTTPGAERGWAAGEPERAVAADGAVRGWTAGRPTT